MSKEIDLEFHKGQLVVVVTDTETGTTVIPLAVTRFTPVGKVPIRAIDPSGAIPQMVLDYLLKEHLKDEDIFWHDYFKARELDQAVHAEAIAEADRTFKASDMSWVR